MMEQDGKKRLFFGIEVHAPWPEKLPSGRILEETNRHLTLAFLGDADYEKLLEKLPSFPLPPFKVGSTGLFDACLFLPPRHPHVVAWHVEWLEDNAPLMQFRETLVKWLSENGFGVDTHHPFNPHVTLARGPRHFKEWKNTFTPLPLYIKDIHLFESLGHSHYASLWKYPISAPFEEIEHTADIAFRIYGHKRTHLFHHAQIALAFAFPQMLPFLSKENTCETVEEIVITLNQIVSKADQEIGAPFKAVSFHGDIKQAANQLLMWEMIIDV